MGLDVASGFSGRTSMIQPLRPRQGSTLYPGGRDHARARHRRQQLGVHNRQHRPDPRGALRGAGPASRYRSPESRRPRSRAVVSGVSRLGRGEVPRRHRRFDRRHHESQRRRSRARAAARDVQFQPTCSGSSSRGLSWGAPSSKATINRAPLPSSSSDSTSCGTDTGPTPLASANPSGSTMSRRWLSA